MCRLQLFIACILSYAFAENTSWIQYPITGYATMTHYTLPQNYVGSCGCVGKSTGGRARYDSRAS